MALLTIRSGVNNHPERSVLQFVTDRVRQGGVISGFQVSEKSGGVGMSVDVTPGTMYARASGECYPINSVEVNNVAVSLNSSTNPRLDVLVVYIDLEATPVADSEGADIAKFALIPGTPAINPVVPTADEIASVVGVSAPYEILAEIRVGSQVTAITDENITDKRRNVYIKSSREVITLTAAGALTLDASRSDSFEVTMSGNITLSPPANMNIGDIIAVTFIQDNAGGHELTCPNLTALSADMSLASGPRAVTGFIIERASYGYTIYATGKEY